MCPGGEMIGQQCAQLVVILILCRGCKQPQYITTPDSRQIPSDASVVVRAFICAWLPQGPHILKKISLRGALC